MIFYMITTFTVAVVATNRVSKLQISRDQQQQQKSVQYT